MMATRMPPTSFTLAGLKTRPDAGSNAGLSLNAASSVRKTFCARNSPLNAEISAQRRFAVSELPMPGHGIDSEQIGGVGHVEALHHQGLTGALPHVAAVEEERIARAGFRAQPVDQSLQVRKAAHAAVAVRGVLIIEEGEGVGDAATRHDVEIFEEGAADDVRRLSTHIADADIDARFAEIHRLQLGVGVGQMQDADIAEAADVVEIVVGRQRDARRNAGSGRDAKPAQEIPAVQVKSPNSSFRGADEVREPGIHNHRMRRSESPRHYSISWLWISGFSLRSAPE